MNIKTSGYITPQAILEYLPNAQIVQAVGTQFRELFSEMSKEKKFLLISDNLIASSNEKEVMTIAYNPFCTEEYEIQDLAIEARRLGWC